MQSPWRVGRKGRNELQEAEETKVLIVWQEVCERQESVLSQMQEDGKEVGSGKAGEVGPGWVRPGLARRGQEWHGEVWPALVRRGKARRGESW